MTYEMVVGLNVINDEKYALYRQDMMPILKKFGGQFRYDFSVARVLKSQTEDPINRVFKLSFPCKDDMQAFFENKDYQLVKATYFDCSVESTTIISNSN